MTIGILKEINTSENRVLLIPSDVSSLVEAGHQVFVENGAGVYSNFSDQQYESAGATILPSAEKIFQKVELVLKVQAPMPVEYELYTSDHISFSFLHLVNNPELLSVLAKSGAIFFSSEMLSDTNSHRSVLSAMSDIAGKMAIINGAKYLEKQFGGKGKFICGLNGIDSTNITILGAGTAGIAAARFAATIGANVTIIEVDESRRVNFRSPEFQNNYNFYEYSRGVLREVLLETDILIASVWIPGKKPPILVSRDDIKLMQPGSLVIDLSADEGGCIETTRPTTIDKPIYVYDGIVHFCVTNLPSSVPYTASHALSKAIIPYIMQIAQLGMHEAIAISPEIRSGLVLYRGKIVNKDIAETVKKEYYDILELLELNI